MFGLIGKMMAAPGLRDALIAILLEGTADMAGCLSYVIARGPGDTNALRITEVWDSEASHRASLSLPAVQQAIARGSPIIAGFGERTVTEPVGATGSQTPEGDRERLTGQLAHLTPAAAAGRTGGAPGPRSRRIAGVPRH